MTTEDGDIENIPNGWPLGLENMNMRLVQVSTESPPSATTTTDQQPTSFRLPTSTTFSSFSSSNLNTESTVSFFQDQSVTLGRLIGMNPEDTQSFYFQRRQDIILMDSLAFGNQQSSETSQGICVPLLHNIIIKRSRSKSNAKLL